MNEEVKEQRRFVAVSEDRAAVVWAKHARDAATKALSSEVFEDCNVVTIFDLKRGTDYRRAVAAARA